ncbi:MAG: glycerophosphoryl diester phosphodiesterase [Gemmatimonadales bacterium]|nr:glycerophosphoryl diester phosphodiesterase [Gemmatimonadales bacterium]
MNSLLDLAGRPVIAHRGASGSAPENTLEAFDLALRQGADAFELDVRLTADGVPVVIHDPTMERTTARRHSVAGETLAQLREADAGARFSPDGGRSFPFRGSGVVIPTLAQVLDTFPDMPLLLDIKESRAQAAVRQLLLEKRAADRTVLASDDAAALTGLIRHGSPGRRLRGRLRSCIGEAFSGKPAVFLRSGRSRLHTGCFQYRCGIEGSKCPPPGSLPPHGSGDARCTSGPSTTLPSLSSSGGPALPESSRISRRG